MTLNAYLLNDDLLLATLGKKKKSLHTFINSFEKLISILSLGFRVFLSYSAGKLI